MHFRELHEKYAPNRAAFDLVYTHCEIVWRLASQLLPPDLDADLVRAGCLLHDIGVYRLGQAEYIRHGLLGHELLREAGLPEHLCRFCSHHTGVGITRDDVERQGLPLPAGDYLAETGEERLVMYADKFHSKTTPPRFITTATYRIQLGRHGAGKVRLFDEMVEQYGEPDLTALAAEYGHPIT
jgi:uncharacterized protein